MFWNLFFSYCECTLRVGVEIYVKTCVPTLL